MCVCVYYGSHTRLAHQSSSVCGGVAQWSRYEYKHIIATDVVAVLRLVTYLSRCMISQ